MEPCMCGGCPRCGVEDMPEVEFTTGEVIEMYQDRVQGAIKRADVRTEMLLDLAEEYRSGAFHRRMEQEEIERQMDNDGSDYPY